MIVHTILPFQYQDHPVRVVQDDEGEAWFVAAEVCCLLGFGNPRQAIESHVDPEDVQKLDTPTTGGTQRQNYINESGLYALILGSRKPGARRFKRWVTHEVLPQIRKTGSYSTPHVESLPVPPSFNPIEVDLILRAGEWIGKREGVRPGIAAAGVLDCLEKISGLSLAPLRLALPPAAAQGPRCTLNATALGALLGMDARTTNMVLAERGLQRRNIRNEWDLTSAGECWGEAIPFVRGSHAGYQILWSAEIADHLASERQSCA